MSTIVIDALGISQPGGGRSATLNVLCEILRLDMDRRYLLLLDQHEDALAIGPHVEQVVVPTRGRLVCRAWAQATWPWTLRRRGADLVHHIKNLTTLWLPGASVVTLYDLAILLHPEIYPRSDVVYWRHIQPLMLRRADRIVAISQTTARDLVQHYGLPADAIRVIYPAYDPAFAPAAEADMARVRQVYGTSERYLIHVGSLSQKKNLLTLLVAYETLRRQGYAGRLVLVGRCYGKGHDAAFFARLAATPYGDDVVLTGPVPSADLPALYSAAEAMVYPSLHEGYGIAPLEAMACGTPVVTTRVGALPEVLGDAGLTIEDPRDATALAEAVARVVHDAQERARLVDAGLQRAARYSAAEAARQHVVLYRELL